MRDLALSGPSARTARAQAPDTELGPFRSNDSVPGELEMHETTAPCTELTTVIAKTFEQQKLTCGRVTAKKVGGRLAEIYRSQLSSGFEIQTIAVVLVIHDGDKLFASPPITASSYSKLGAYSTVESAQPALRSVAGSAVLDLMTKNIWHEQRDTPAHASDWQAHAFLACRIADDRGTCSFVALGTYSNPCTATLDDQGTIHYVSKGDMPLPLPHD